MNIFYLDHNPVIAAEYHCDKHVVKMITESVQLLSTAHFARTSERLAYDPTHMNHPCVEWLLQTYANRLWLIALLRALHVEYQYRYETNHVHLAYAKFQHVSHKLDESNLSVGWWHLTRPALAMPNDCKCTSPIESYRQYYRKHKVHLHHWKRRGAPAWLSM